MRWTLAAVLVSALSACTAGPALGQGAGAELGAQAGKMDNLLSLWEQQSATITTLDARFRREDVSKAWGTTEVYWGRAILKSPDFAFLDFQKDEGKNKPPAPYEQIRCTGKEVYHYRNANHQIIIYPMPAQKAQRALQDGPLPFLFNMRAAEAKERYAMALVNETATLYVIQIKPLKEIDQAAFSQADILLDKQKFQPEAMRLWAPNLKDFQVYRFTGEGCYIRPNVPVANENFEGLTLKGWDVIRNPNGDARPLAGNAVGAQPPAPRGGAPAARGGAVAPRR